MNGQLVRALSPNLRPESYHRPSRRSADTPVPANVDEVSKVFCKPPLSQTLGGERENGLCRFEMCSNAHPVKE